MTGSNRVWLGRTWQRICVSLLSYQAHLDTLSPVCSVTMSVPVPSGALLVRAERFDLAPQKCLIDIYRISGSSPAFYRWYRGPQGMGGACSDRQVYR